jgi:hypothetical protein
MKYVFWLFMMIALIGWVSKVNPFQPGTTSCTSPLIHLAALDCNPGITHHLIVHLAFWIAAYLVIYGVVVLVRLATQARNHNHTNIETNRRHPSLLWLTHIWPRM